MDKVYRIMPDGQILTIYNDDLMDMNLGEIKVQRASNVLFDEATQTWFIESDGRVINSGFKKRDDAISCEIQLLNMMLESDTLNIQPF